MFFTDYRLLTTEYFFHVSQNHHNLLTHRPDAQHGTLTGELLATALAHG